MLLQKQTIQMKGKTLKLSITSGFWKRCGFAREEAQIIHEDIDKYLEALKLAVFYGNQLDFGWEKLEDMKKMLSDDDFDDLEEEFSDELGKSMVFFMPKKLRDYTIKQIEEQEKKQEDILDAAFDAVDNAELESLDKTPGDESGKKSLSQDSV